MTSGEFLKTVENVLFFKIKYTKIHSDCYFFHVLTEKNY